jgi:hypothetical protein
MTRHSFARGLLLLACGLGLPVGGEGLAQRRVGPGTYGPARPLGPPRRALVPLRRPHKDDLGPGLHPRVRVQAQTRFDWGFALGAAAPAEAPAKYDPTQVYYQLFVPQTYRPALASPLILFVSASNDPDELGAWLAVCRKYGVLYASPHEAGDRCPPAKRLRMALDVLDDVRRRLNVDTDRVYVGGLSEGARTACAVSYAFPEFIGGVVAVAGASSLREEPMLRDRVRERLSVALVVGDRDQARAEMERYRLPVLLDLEVRAKLWLGRGARLMPQPSVLEEVFVWLEAEKGNRRALGEKYPAARVAEGSYPSAQAWAREVVEEAKERLEAAGTREGGLMQLDGVVRRWKGGPAAREAKKLLEGRKGTGWEKVHARRQQGFFFREATALDAWLEGPLPLHVQRSKPILLKASMELWKQVLEHDPDTREGLQAEKKVTELKKLLAGW